MRVLFISTVIIALTLTGCSCGKSNLDASQFPDDLQESAYKTYTTYLRAVKTGAVPDSDEIPLEYWTAPIKALHPIKVYKHRVNIVIVQSMNNETEKGVYIYIPVSSYLPQSGDDGFSYIPVANGVYRYRKSRL